MLASIAERLESAETSVKTTTSVLAREDHTGKGGGVQ